MEQLQEFLFNNTDLTVQPFDKGGLVIVKRFPDGLNGGDLIEHNGNQHSVWACTVIKEGVYMVAINVGAEHSKGFSIYVPKNAKIAMPKHLLNDTDHRLASTYDDGHHGKIYHYVDEGVISQPPLKDSAIPELDTKTDLQQRMLAIQEELNRDTLEYIKSDNKLITTQLSRRIDIYIHELRELKQGIQL